MAIRDTDKLLVGRGDTSYYVSLSDSGLINSAGNGGFVLKSGDVMTGRLVMESQKDIVDYSVPPSDQARIEFVNKNSTGQERRTYIYKPGYSYDIVCTNPFFASSLYTAGNFYAYREKVEADGIRTRAAKNPRISFVHDSNYPDDRNKDYGVIKFGSNDRFKWNNGGGEIRSDKGRVVIWNSTYGYLWGQEVEESALTWGKDGIVRLRDSNGSLGTEGQILTRSATGNLIEWTTPDTADDGPTDWDLINANDKNWGQEFYQGSKANGFSGYNSSENEYSGGTNYGIFISDNMLEKLLKNDYPDREVDIDQWVKNWTGEGTITFKLGYYNSTHTRTLTKVERVNYQSSSNYPGVKLMWSGGSIDFYANYMEIIKTEGAFTDTGADSAGGKAVTEVETVYRSRPASSVTADQPARIDTNGNLTTYSGFGGSFFPFAWLKSQHPNATGFKVNLDGAAVNERPDHTKIELATMNGVEGVKVYQTYSNYSTSYMWHIFKGVYVEVDYDHTF